jgi:hypothetical protein
MPPNSPRLAKLLPFTRECLALGAVAIGAFACRPAQQHEDGMVSAREMADAVHAVLEADRTIYTQHVVNRLQNELQVIKASEHWREDRALPLPAQMFRMGAELATSRQTGLYYALLSEWPISRQNEPRTEVERAGLQFVAKNPNENYYSSERLGESNYFTAIYPDKAVANACVQCHNAHKDSPRHDFALGDVMGGVVVRIAAR